MTNNKNLNKKIFEDIMGINDCGRINIKDTCITYNYGHNCINLESFFFKCKDWALELGYELRSWGKRCEIIEISRKYYIDVPVAKGNSEIEAVILATNYLYNNLMANGIINKRTRFEKI